MAVRAKPIDEKEFKRLTKPTVRLFLSVDLENSTQLKQATDKTPERWLTTVRVFLQDFPQLFEAKLQERERQFGGPKMDLPPVWKVLGDELVFAAIINKRLELLTLVEAFQDALQKWNQDAREQKEGRLLKVKGAAWVAGFPVVNAVLETGEKSEDYIGPSMDAGFRISKLATPRRMAITVDLAWLLLRLKFKRRVHFDGQMVIKGLAEEVGYPVLWIEVEKSDYVSKGAVLLGRAKQKSRRLMTELCAHFIYEFGVPKHLPFLQGEPELTPQPPDYEENLDQHTEFLRRQIYMVVGKPPSQQKAIPASEQEALLARVKKQNKPRP